MSPSIIIIAKIFLVDGYFDVHDIGVEPRVVPLVYNGVEIDVLSAPWNIAMFYRNTFVCGGNFE